MTDPRDLDQPTDDELRAADAAAQVRVHRGFDSAHETPDESTRHAEEARHRAAGTSEPDPRDLDQPTDDVARAAAAAASVRVDRSPGSDDDPTESRPG